MASTREGSVHLFRFAGVDVFLHWSWFVVAIIEIQSRSGRYTSIAWNVAEYLALFLIVTLHEFGHAMACRQVGGIANQIVLWPLGGVAYVDPPPRAGATLWSIAAGPLVNVVLLPVYPLDGGQIFRALLWFVIGRARSLMVATSLGFVGVAGFIALALWRHSIWYGVLALFMLMNCWGGLQHARALLKMSKLPRRVGFACPTCHSTPPLGNFWKCSQCGQPFDTFATGAACPSCGTGFAETKCLDCGRLHPMTEWTSANFAPANA